MATVNLTRRGFALGAACAALAPARLFAGSAADFDESAAVFLSDTHINGNDMTTGKNPRRIKDLMRRNLAAAVTEILRMDPLPRHVFIFGDLAYMVGRLVDYRRAHKDLKLLTDAGIKLTIGMGNHDHRKPFLEVWPEYAERTLVEGAIHTVTNLPDYDFIMLDTLDEIDRIDAHNHGLGKFSEATQEWMLAELPKWPRPFFLGAHHELDLLNVGGKRLRHTICKFPNCRGFIHGHNHIWRTNISSWITPDAVPWLTLPSNGHWGDIGYVTFKTELQNGRKAAVARFIQKDFRLDGFDSSKPRPAAWDARLADVKGARCTFVI